MRCLKRYVAREAFTHLHRFYPPPATTTSPYRCPGQPAPWSSAAASTRRGLHREPRHLPQPFRRLNNHDDASSGLTTIGASDPELEAKVRDVVGLYLNPPDKAVVLSIDEKSQIQALDRTAPILPLRPGLAERRSHDDVRHGTTTLFAALEVATGRVVDACYPRHRHEEFLRFLKQVAKAYPRRKLHIVVDNYATHKHPAVRAWLARHPRVRLHFTPTSGSWLNLVEAFFSIITRQALRRGNFPTVADLIAAIGRFIDAWNDRCAPFTWTKDPDTVIAKATRPRRRKTQQTPDTEH